MLIRYKSDIATSEITDQRLYLDRRRFLALGAVGAAAMMLPVGRAEAEPLDYAKGTVTLDEKLTPLEAVTTYNNYYEFGTDKEDPAKTAPGRLKTKPWTVSVEGECAKPARVAYDDLIKPHRLEERIYRLRFVEAWSMVIP